MQSLIERALVNEKNDVQALRDLEATISAEGDEPTPRIMTDGGHPRPTAGWRSPLGGPRYDGPIPGGDRSVEWSEDRVEAAIEEREKRLEERKRAEAVAGPEDDGLRADGGSKEAKQDNAHASSVNQALNDAEGDDDLDHPLLNIGDHVTDEVDEDRDATMVVVGLPSVKAAACELDDDGKLTVADVNPERFAEDRVVEVAFCDHSDTDLDGTKRYSFPRGRLALETPIHGRGGDNRDEWVEDDNGDTVPERSEPADFGGGDSTGVQDL